MAFVSRAERNFAHSPNKGFDLGPGSYLGQDQHRPQHGFAPFLSTAERDDPQTTVQGYTPGPGSYSSPFLATKSVSGGADLYGRQRLWGPFASREDRFKQADNRLAPGPGSYQVEKQWVKPKKPSPKQDWNALNWLRLPSAPSIPAPKQAFGYDETANGELIMQKNPEKVFEGTPTDCVGPGHYNVKDPNEVSKSKGPTWGKSKAARAAVSAPPTGSEIGPGSYNQAPGSLAPMYKFKSNAVFLSGTKRASYIPPSGKSPGFDSETSEDLDENSKDFATPGPGYYFNQEKMSAFRQKPVPERLQFFGSTAARFERKRLGNPSIGPGTYIAAKMTSPERQKQTDSKAPFASSNLRFQEAIELTPGPGSYKDSHFLDDAKKRVWGRQGVFGTTEKRFVGQNPGEEIPGPGYYPPDADKRIGMHNSNSHKPLSVFLSKSKRATEAVGLKDAGPAPGQYNVPSGFEKKSGFGGVGNPLLAGIGDSRKKEAAFNAKSRRFLRQVPTESLGPGSYDPKLPQEINKTENQKSTFLPQESRFKEKAVLPTPGPGAYEDEQAGDWNKRSFNILFTEYV